MSKKIFIKPKPTLSINIPQDVEDRIDQWITGAPTSNQGSESEKALQKQIPEPAPQPEKEIRINFNINQQLHRDLKIMCVKKGTSIKDLCIQLLKEELKKHQD